LIFLPFQFRAGGSGGGSSSFSLFSLIFRARAAKRAREPEPASVAEKGKDIEIAAAH
jgi:hypothetical protein